MPWAPGRPCAQAGCPALVRGPGARCPAHPRPGYSADWPAISKAYLRTHPACEVTGCGAAATDVDHRVARVNGGSDAWSNLEALCHPHHASKTVLRDGGFGHARA
jgi:5-methylcytosine-specific restriction enzyme A